jgi:hypothetical protein
MQQDYLALVVAVHGLLDRLGLGTISQAALDFSVMP